MSDTPDSPDLPQSDPLSGILSSPHKRRGFIARKTKAVRDRINQMLLDGFSYKDLISAIGEDGKDLNDDIVGRSR
jgi:hypothetical protein